MSTDEDPSEAEVSSPSESPLPPPSTPPNTQNRIRRTARIRTIPVPPPHLYMLSNYIPPPNSPDTEDTLPPRKRTRSSTPPSSTDELSEAAKASIARYHALPRSPTPDFPTPPRVYEVGESSQAAIERQPTIATLMSRMDRQ